MDPGEQKAFAEREELPYPLLNDGPLLLRDQLGLPTFDVLRHDALQAPDASWPAPAGSRRSSTPSSRPDRNAAEVESWLLRARYLKCGRPFGPASLRM